MAAIKLVSEANVRTYLNFSSTNQDTLIGELIEQVSEDIQSYCDRTFTAGTDVLEYPLGGGPYLSLKRFPITSVSHVRYNSDYDFTDSADDIDSDDYTVAGNFGDSGLIYYKGKKWTAVEDALEVKYTGGYSDTAGILDVPADLKKACIMQVAYLFDRRKTLGVRTASGQEGSLNFQGDYEFLPPVKGIIDRYRRLTIV